MSSDTHSPTPAVREIDQRLQEAWPHAQCELLARDPFEFLVAVICSAQTSDTRVNQVMAVLQEHLCGVEAYAAMPLPELSTLLARLPLFRQKARRIHDAARHLVDHYDGQLPTDATSLRRLPGVGEKTAAVVLGNRLGQPAIAVDVHVERCARRLGLSHAADKRVIAEDLRRRFPPPRWVSLCHQLIRLGREYCRPRRPWCSRCPLRGHCPRNGVDDAR